MNCFVRHCVSRGGQVRPLLVPHGLTNGTGTFNPTVLAVGDELLVNIRHCQYTLYHAENNKYEHQWGPLLYLNPQNDITLTTTNFIAKVNTSLETKSIQKIDTSFLDARPLWEFVGLEDGRLINWDNKIFLCGVRRDTTPNGEGRMELSEIEFDGPIVKEVSRQRIPTPAFKKSYCEKNWMPVTDKPYHFVKWTHPTEVVKYCPTEKTTTTVVDKKQRSSTSNLRGGSQVIPYKDGYLALGHLTYLYRSEQDRKDATYRHQFVYWDKHFNFVKESPIFSFLNTKIEFSCGMTVLGDKFYITFGVQDNSAYIMSFPFDLMEEILGA